MHSRLFLSIIILLFFSASVWLTIRQEFLFQKADQDFVSASFVDPKNEENFDFVIEHSANTERSVNVRYRFENGDEQENTITLQPKERKLFEPEQSLRDITIEFQNSTNVTQLITLFKK